MKILILLCVLSLASFPIRAQQASDSRTREIESVRAHAIFANTYACTEHGAGELTALGDDLGRDCLIQKLVEKDGRLFLKAFDGDGARNEDWYGWGAPVLSPCDCEVEKISINPDANEPGKLGKPPASVIKLRRDDGVHFILAHIMDPAVKPGERVHAGQALAKVGNNGYSRSPHVHIGAWKGIDALQIEWDQKTLHNGD